jgi:predicted metalloprotease with PDZ domain
MRLLLEDYGLPKPGFTDAELQAAFEKVAGVELGEFRNRYIYGTDEIDFDRYWRLVGLQAKGVYANPAPTLATEGKPPGTLGLRTRSGPGDRVTISNVLTGFPAYETGLNSNDELVALDGQKLDAGNVTEQLNEIRAGQAVQLMVFRRERLMTFNLTAAPKPFDTYAFSLSKESTPEQKAVLQGWLQAELK